MLLARELLVTTIRGLSEGGGQPFGAELAGKVKMFVQAVTIGVILCYVNYFAGDGVPDDVQRYAQATRDVFIWATVVVTLWSGVVYLRKLPAVG